MSAAQFLAQVPGYWPNLAACLVFAGVSAHWGTRLLAWSRARRSLRPVVNARPAWWLVLALVALFAVPVLPFEGRRLSLAAVGAGVLGEFSALTVLMVITSYLRNPQSDEHKGLLITLTALGLVLYMSVLTYTGYDVYRLGYAHSALSSGEHWIMPAFVALWALLLPARPALLLCLASGAWMLGIQGSNNYWDHLIDVPLFIYAFGMSLKWSWKRLANS